MTPSSLSGKLYVAHPTLLGQPEPMPALKKRSLLLSGHATSIALEPEFWAILDEMAKVRSLSLAALIASIDRGREGRPLASACRLAALAYARDGRKVSDASFG